MEMRLRSHLESAIAVNFFYFSLGALSVYRLALMGSSEEGPAAIFAKLRHKVPPKTNPGRGIRCLFCWSVWMSALVTAFLFWLHVMPTDEWPLWWLGMSAVAIMLNQAFTKR